MFDPKCFSSVESKVSRIRNPEAQRKARAAVLEALQRPGRHGRPLLGMAVNGLELAVIAMEGPDPEFALLRIAEAMRDLEQLGAEVRRLAAS